MTMTTGSHNASQGQVVDKFRGWQDESRSIIDLIIKQVARRSARQMRCRLPRRPAWNRSPLRAALPWQNRKTPRDLQFQYQLQTSDAASLATDENWPCRPARVFQLSRTARVRAI